MSKDRIPPHTMITVATHHVLMQDAERAAEGRIASARAHGELDLYEYLLESGLLSPQSKAEVVLAMAERNRRKRRGVPTNPATLLAVGLV
jgi:hypothetical protein